MLGRGKYQMGMLKSIAFWFAFMCFPKLLDWFPGVLEMFDQKSVEFFVNIIRSQMESRRNSPEAVKRNDMIDLVVQALEEGDDKVKKTFADKKAFEVAAISNIFVMFFAGFDTTSTASSVTW